MIAIKTLEKLYDISIDRKSLTMTTLNLIGINDKEIDELVKSKKLELQEDGTYKLTDIDGLYQYGLKIVKSPEYSRSYKIFLKCFQIDPTHYGTIIQLFIRSIKRNIESSFDYIRILYKLEDGIYRNDCNFYLFLLSFMIDIPDDLKDYVLSLTREDILTNPDMQLSNAEMQNQVRGLCFNVKFSTALRIVNASTNEKNASDDLILLRLLIKFANDAQKGINRTVAELATSGEFEEIIRFLDETASKHKLSAVNIKMKMIVNDILQILNHGALITPSAERTKGIFDAIDAKNYIEAYHFNSQLAQENSHGSEKTALTILLEIIYKLIKEKEIDPNYVPKFDDVSFLDDSTLKSNNLSLYLSNKLKISRVNGISLLDPMSSKERQKVYEILRSVSYKDFAFFAIGDEPNRFIVIRYRPIIGNDIDLKETLLKARECVTNMDYEKAIEYYRLILGIKIPKSFVYGDLGVLYSKVGNIQLAIDYLTVAKGLYEKEMQEGYNQDYRDYTATLNRLTSGQSLEVDSPKNRFNHDLDDYYNIPNIEGIADALQSGVTFESLAISFNLSTEQTLLVMLIMAREYYIVRNFTMGDMYLKQVEKSSDRTNFVNRKLDEIRKNKRFYQNKNDGSHKSLVLKSSDKKM